MRRALLPSLAVFGLLSVPWGATAQGPSFPVVVFEGRGLGHGVGMPLDGADHLALEGGVDAGDILDRFYPGTGRSTGEGLVRVLLGARDDLRDGVDVLLPGGGTVRDGRTTPVAPSFPIRVPAGKRVKLSFTEGFYRAEVLDERSVSGTVEITPASDAPTTTVASGLTGATALPLATSERSLWIEPRGDGVLTLAPDPGGDERTYRGVVEIVMEAERLHVVGELDVETYLTGLSLPMPEGGTLEPAALEAAVIAARSHALRAARAQPLVGGFHVYADARSFAYVGPDGAPEAVERAVRATKGRIVTFGGEPAATLMSASGGGSAAAPAEVFGADAADLPYLIAGEYTGGQEFGWRVDMRLSEVARRLGYPGDAETVAVASTGPSGRPTSLRISGSAGDVEVDAPEIHAALRLPSSRFAVRVESRTEPLPDRADSPPFQELPGRPLEGNAAVAAGAGDGEGSSGRLPLILIAAAGMSLVLAFGVLLFADVQRRVSAARVRRASRLRHPTQPPPHREPPAEPILVEEAAPWHNEPEWLTEIVPEDQEAPESPDVDEAALAREIERIKREAASSLAVLDDDGDVPETRSLREVLGWDGAPDWLDEPEEPPAR